jgi:hypothetical protein
VDIPIRRFREPLTWKQVSEELRTIQDLITYIKLGSQMPDTRKSPTNRRVAFTRCWARNASLKRSR